MQQRAEKEEIETRLNAARARNEPEQKALDIQKRKLATKTADFRDLVSGCYSSFWLRSGEITLYEW